MPLGGYGNQSGFRRASIEFDVLDENGHVPWASGRTNGAGLIVGATGAPVAGELWWKVDCSGRLALIYQSISRIASVLPRARTRSACTSWPVT